jgi:hypothetical protein
MTPLAIAGVVLRLSENADNARAALSRKRIGRDRLFGVRCRDQQRHKHKRRQDAGVRAESLPGQTISWRGQ